MRITWSRSNARKSKKAESFEPMFLILKNSAADKNAKVIREAEKVVEKYMAKKREGKRQGSRKRMSQAWWMSFISFGLGMLVTRLLF